VPRVFRRNNIDAPQDLKSPQGDVAQITDRRRHHVKHSLSSVQSLPHAIESMRRRRPTGHQPKIFAKTKGATIVASDSMTNRGVSTFSFPHVIFSFGTAPEYDPKLVVESLIWQKYPHSGTGMLTTS
jgi:hypothetical protein